MHFSSSLADFMERLNEGPAGIDDALAAVEKCAADSGTVLDLQQMTLTDEDLQLISTKFDSLAAHVTKLNLFMNEISVLPASITALSNLEILHAGCNPLESVDAALFAALPKLTEIDVGFSEILSQLPDSFSNLPSLKVLKAGNGRLTSLPPSLFKCSNLEELYLYGNSLKGVSEEIGELRKLKLLNLGRNQIASLPDSIGRCAVLETLHLYENCLSSLPKGVVRLEHLQTLNVNSNANLPMPPREVRCLAAAKSTASFLATGVANGTTI